MSAAARREEFVGASARAAELLRFALVGGSSTAMYFVLTLAMTRLGEALAPASVAAYLASGVFSFVGHRAFTFGSRGPLRGEILSFALLNAAGLAAALAAPLVMTRWLGAPAVYAMIFTCVVAPAINYVALRAFVFCRARAGSAGQGR